MAKKNDALMVVEPLVNVSALEKVRFDDSGKLTVQEKRGLMEVFFAEVRKKQRQSESLKDMVTNRILNEYRKEVDFDKKRTTLKKFDSDILELERKIEQKKHEKAVASEEITIETGLDSSGNIANEGYTDDKQEYDYNTQKRRKVRSPYSYAQKMLFKKRNEEVRERIKLAIEKIGEFECNLAKIETMLWLCSTKGEARQIMTSVLGNSDEIMKY